MGLYQSGHVVNSAGADNLGADVTSGWISIEASYGFSVQVKVDNTSTGSTGTAAGAFYVQVSNNGTDWVNITLSTGGTSLAYSSGSDLSAFEDLPAVNARFARVFFDRTGGDGIADVWVYVNRAR